MTRDRWGLIGFILLCLGVSVIGGLATSTSVGGWYQALQKPPFNPPGWVFGPVWTVLYIMISVAGWLIWRSEASAARARALTYYAIQLALNLAWSFMFFGFKRPDLALINILALLFMIHLTMFAAWRIDAWAGRLFVPYALWVAFASVLNYYIWRLN